MQRYNFDRHRGKRGGKPMAEGIAVHADDMDEALYKAAALNNDLMERLVFRDNERCMGRCHICSDREEYVTLGSDEAHDLLAKGREDGVQAREEMGKVLGVDETARNFVAQ